MTDYLQSVGKRWRIVSVVACTFAAVHFLLMSLLVWTDMIRNRKFDYEGKPLWIGAVIVSVLGAAAAFIAWRLVRRQPAPNGITLMPIWLIQCFGLLFLVGLAFITYKEGITLFAVEAAFVGLAMVFVGKYIEKKRKQKV